MVNPDNKFIVNAVSELHQDVRAMRGEWRDDIKEMSSRVATIEKSQSWHFRRDTFLGSVVVLIAAIWSRAWEFLG